MLTHRRVVSLCLWIVPLMCASSAHAQNTTCAIADLLFLNEVGERMVDASASRYWRIIAAADRSYSIMAWAPTQDVAAGGAALSLQVFQDAGCSTPLPTAWVTDTDFEPRLAQAVGHVGGQVSVTPSANAAVYIKVTNVLPVAYDVHVVAIDTTLRSPWWFVGGTNQAYVEMKNTMDTPTTARLLIFDSEGVPCARENVQLKANGNAAIAVNAYDACVAAVFGSAWIAFPGTPSGITANLTTIDGVNGTSFDAPFSPRMVWSISGR